MPTILIVDDEKLNRAGMKKILGETFPQVSVLDAKNGKEALDIINAQKIDLLITDVRMPIMDGIELMHAVAKMDKHPEIIVLSGYDDFSYVKAALTSGAVSYILKPVDKKELTAAVETAILRRTEEEKRVQKEIINSILETGRLPKEVHDVAFQQGRTFYCLFVTGVMHAAFVYSALKIVPHIIIDEQKNTITVLADESFLDVCIRFATEYECQIGVSLPSQKLSDLKVMQRQAFVASFGRLYAPKAKTVSVFKYNSDISQQEYAAVSEQAHKLSVILGTVKNEELAKQIETLFHFENQSEEVKASSLYFVYTELTDVLLKRYCNYSDSDLYLLSKSMLIENIAAFETASEWVSNVRDYLLYLNAMLRKDCGDYPFINQAITYMNENFMKDINMATVANQVSVNYTYFSEKFKECEGINFNDYLRRLRIEKAKQLLETGCFKVYEVARKSGFSDVKYFIRNFKAETGLSPTNYRRKTEKNA